jgi:hypothetical protein
VPITKADTMCAATVNWTLFTDMPSLAHYVMLKSTVGYTSFVPRCQLFRFLSNPRNDLTQTAMCRFGAAKEGEERLCPLSVSASVEPTVSPSPTTTKMRGNRKV